MPSISFLISCLIDSVNGFRWMLADENKRGDPPKSVLEILAEKPQTETPGFESGEDFEAYRQNLLTGGETYG